MSITNQEIRNFYFQINISPNIIYNVIKTFNTPSKDNTSIRIYYFINENDELILNNQISNPDKYSDLLFYEIFIIKIDFIKNKSKMIMIYNNEKKEYKIKIWASKIEKPEIKIEYNKIIKKLCDKKTGNIILKNLLKLTPDKYTIYYFPSSVTIYEKELVFIYILIFTTNEKSKFQNFKQIKDLICYSKSFLIPKINDLLMKFKTKNIQKRKKSNNTIKIHFSSLINDNKENQVINKTERNKSNNYISPKSKEIKITYDEERFKKAMDKKSKFISKYSLNFMKKPYNKIVFNYSFEKNDNENSLNRIKKYQKSLIEQRNPITSIDSYKKKTQTQKAYNYINFPFNQFKRLNNESIDNFPFSLNSKSINNNSINNNSINNNSTIIPYEKKRPSSIPKKLIRYLSSNNFNQCYYNYCNEKDIDKDLFNKYTYSTFENKSLNNKSKNRRLIYKRKSFSKKKSQESIDSKYFVRNLNCSNTPNSNSTYDNTNKNTIFNLDNINNTNINTNKSIFLNTNKRNKFLHHNGSMISDTHLIKTYDYMKDYNEKNNIGKIPINKKTTLNLNLNKNENKSFKNNIQIIGININRGNQTSRNIINKNIRKQLIYKQKSKDKNNLFRTGENNMKKMNESEEEITLFI